MEAHEMFEHLAVTPDDVSLRDGAALPRQSYPHRLVGPADRVVDLEICGELFHRFGIKLRVLVSQPDYFDPFALVIPGDLNQMRDLLNARAAPGGPQIHNQNLARIIGEPRLLSVEQIDACLHYGIR